AADVLRSHCITADRNSTFPSDLKLPGPRLPPELYSIWESYPWRLGEAFCYLRQTILELTSYASVLTITAFTVERYLAICRPLLTHKIAVLSRAVKIIVVIWIVSLLAAVPYAVHTRLYHSVTWPPTGQPLKESLVCSIPDKWLEGRMTYIFQCKEHLQNDRSPWSPNYAREQFRFRSTQENLGFLPGTMVVPSTLLHRGTISHFYCQVRAISPKSLGAHSSLRSCTESVHTGVMRVREGWMWRDFIAAFQRFATISRTFSRTERCTSWWRDRPRNIGRQWSAVEV
ncbi:hypothetical protein BaRGS_00015657, partial [Batillaria attramentaria]